MGKGGVEEGWQISEEEEEGARGDASILHLSRCLPTRGIVYSPIMIIRGGRMVVILATTKKMEPSSGKTVGVKEGGEGLEKTPMFMTLTSRLMER